MKVENIIEVIDNLIGKVEPQGETSTDDKRFENLQKLCEVLDHYSVIITDVSRHKNRKEYSIKRAGEFADKFIKETVEYYKEYL